MINKTNKNWLMPRYEIDENLYHLINQIESYLKQITITEKDSVYPVTYRDVNDKNYLDFSSNEAYKNMLNLNVFDKNDLCKINSLLVNKNVTDFRQSKVMTKRMNSINEYIEYIDYQDVPEALDFLNKWYASSKDHVLVKACAYAISWVHIIHPFKDGNGRTSRYIMTSLMSKYDDKLRYFTFEELLNDRNLRLFTIRLLQDTKTPLSPFNDGTYNKLIFFLLTVLRNKLEERVTGIKPAKLFH